MADLGSNSLWSDLTTNASGVETEILGPSYSYGDNIPGPGTLGVGTEGSFGQLGANASAVSTYVQALITGDPPLGNQFFVNTGGTCVAPDGSTQSRMNYINNVASGADLMPSSMSEIGSDFNGLIPGIVGDIEGLNPLHLFNALTADGTPGCECYKCNVTTGNPYAFLTTSLSADFDSSLCTQVDASNCIAPSTESFTVGSSFSTIPTIIAACILLYLINGKGS